MRTNSGVNPGDLRHRILILQKVATTTDSDGYPIETWKPFFSAWAKVEPVAGAVFTKAADTNTATGEFEDQAGLIACIGDMDDWAAADNNGAIDITAATDSVDFNDIDIVVSLYRVTADGVDGTVGRAGDMYADETYLYVASQDNGIGDTNWRRIALGNAYYPD